MGWTLSGCKFNFSTTPTRVHPHGNNAAWACFYCQHPILFTYRGQGGRQQNPVACPDCKHRFFLEPQFNMKTEPPKDDIRAPAEIMTIHQQLDLGEIHTLDSL